MSKKQKNRDYYLDGKNLTAKKEKNNFKHKVEVSHNSHSTSHNHHKYEPDQDIEEQPTNKKQLLTIKQLKMMIRCCGEYCHYEPHSHNNAQKYKITSKMLNYLRANYKIVGPAKEIRKYEELLQHLTPLPERNCEKCQQLGKPCDKYQLEQIEKQLETDILTLENLLDEKMEESQQFMRILQKKQSKEASNQEQLQRLKQIYQLQVQLLQQLG